MAKSWALSYSSNNLEKEKFEEDGKVEEERGKEIFKIERERDGSERNGHRSTSGAGHPDVFQRPPKTSLHATCDLFLYLFVYLKLLPI